MSTLDRLTADLTASMKARDAFRTNTLRQAIAAVRTAEKAGTAVRALSEDEVQSVLAGEVKKRRDTAVIYLGAGADERADTETSEADLLEAYLPPAVNEDQLDAVVADAIETTGAASLRDMGAVMRAATASAAQLGRVDGKVLAQHVRRALSGDTAG